MRNILSKNKTFKAMIRIKVKIKKLYNAKWKVRTNDLFISFPPSEIFLKP